MVNREGAQAMALTVDASEYRDSPGAARTPQAAPAEATPPDAPSAPEAPGTAPQAAAGPATRGGRRRWLIGGLAAAVGAPLVWYLATKPLVPAGASAGSASASDAPAKGAAPLVGHQAPDFTLKDPAGKTVELRQFRGKAVLLNFWATWCVPCKEELPEFEQAYRQYKDQGFVLLGVSIDSEASAKDVPAYLQEGSPRTGSYTFPVALDTKQEVVRAYKLTGIPGSFFIDREGVIRALSPGAINRQKLLDQLRTVLPAL